MEFCFLVLFFFPMGNWGLHDELFREPQPFRNVMIRSRRDRLINNITKSDSPEPIVFINFKTKPSQSEIPCAVCFVLF